MRPTSRADFGGGRTPLEMTETGGRFSGPPPPVERDDGWIGDGESRLRVDFGDEQRQARGEKWVRRSALDGAARADIMSVCVWAGRPPALCGGTGGTAVDGGRAGRAGETEMLGLMLWR